MRHRNNCAPLLCLALRSASTAEEQSASRRSASRKNLCLSKISATKVAAAASGRTTTIKSRKRDDEKTSDKTAHFTADFSGINLDHTGSSRKESSWGRIQNEPSGARAPEQNGLVRSTPERGSQNRTIPTDLLRPTSRAFRHAL